MLGESSSCVITKSYKRPHTLIQSIREQLVHASQPIFRELLGTTLIELPVCICVLPLPLRLGFLRSFRRSRSSLFLCTCLRGVCTRPAFVSDRGRCCVPRCFVRANIVAFVVLLLVSACGVERVGTLTTRSISASYVKSQTATMNTYIPLLKLLALQFSCALLMSMLSLVRVMRDLSN